MCAQCMAGAATAGVAATGARAWLATRALPWLTPQRLKASSVALVAAALTAAGLVG